MYNRAIARSSKGRTEDFESFNLGSIPSLAAEMDTCVQNRLKNLIC